MVEENNLIININREDESKVRYSVNEIQPNSIFKILEYVNSKKSFILKKQRIKNALFFKLLNYSFLTNILNSNVNNEDDKKKLNHNKQINILYKMKDNRVLSGSNDKRIMVSFLFNKLLVPMAELIGHDSSVFSLTELDNGRLVSGDFMGFMILWEESNFNLIKKIRPHSRMISKITDLNDEKFASCSFDSLINIYNYELEVIKVIKENTGMCYDMVISKEENLLITCSNNSRIISFSANNNFEKLNEKKEEEKYMYSIIISKQKEVLISAGNVIKIYDLNLNLKKNVNTNHCSSITKIIQLNSKLNFGKFFIISNDKSFSVFNEDFTPQEFKNFDKNENAISSLELNDELILVSSKNHDISIINQAKFEEIMNDSN